MGQPSERQRNSDTASAPGAGGGAVKPAGKHTNAEPKNKNGNDSLPNTEAQARAPATNNGPSMGLPFALYPPYGTAPYFFPTYPIHHPFPVATMPQDENALKAQQSEMQKNHALAIVELKQKHRAEMNGMAAQNRQLAEINKKQEAKNKQLSADLAASKEKQKEDERKIKALEKEVEKLKGNATGEADAPRRKRGKSSAALSRMWEERFEELKAYKSTYGNCDVPKKHPQYPELGHWVSRQRSKRKLYSFGKQTTITPEQIRKLDSIGMIWQKLKNEHLPWEERYQQLLKFKEENGHVRVPQLLKNPQGLGEWVQDMRYAYKCFTSNVSKPSKRRITPEQIEKLESIGFEWSLRKRHSNEHYRQLAAAAAAAAAQEESPEVDFLH